MAIHLLGIRHHGPGSCRNVLEYLQELQPDLILLEGFKYSGYPKVEVVRKSVSERPVCDPGTLLAMVTDFSKEELSEDFREIPLFVPNEWGTEQLADYLISRMKL